MVDDFTFLFNCTTVGQALESVTALSLIFLVRWCLMLGLWSGQSELDLAFSLALVISIILAMSPHISNLQTFMIFHFQSFKHSHVHVYLIAAAGMSHQLKVNLSNTIWENMKLMAIVSIDLGMVTFRPDRLRKSAFRAHAMYVRTNKFNLA